MIFFIFNMGVCQEFLQLSGTSLVCSNGGIVDGRGCDSRAVLEKGISWGLWCVGVLFLVEHCGERSVVGVNVKRTGSWAQGTFFDCAGVEGMVVSTRPDVSVLFGDVKC